MQTKNSFQQVKDYVAQQGYVLLSTEYTSSQTPLQILCSKGHNIKPSFSEFKRKARCNECSRSRKPTIDEINTYIAPKGFKVISTEYKDNSTKLQTQCSKGHVWDICWNNLKNGNGCPYCYGNKKYTFDDIKKNLEQFGYKINQNFYKDVSTKIELICPKQHRYSVRYHDFLTGVRCSSCSHQTSRAEQEVLDFVKQYYPNSKKVRFYEVIENQGAKYKNKELDIYVPELRLAIEYCGLFWHSDASGIKSSNKHKNKLNGCRENNIRLITLFEDEWLCRKEQVKNLLLSVLGVHNTRLGARNCTVGIIDKVTAKEFVSSQHIQPLHTCDVSFGLFHKDELVGVITGSKHHRQNQNSFVLQRLCFKQGYQIAGGASKLFKYLKQYAISQGFKELVSWSDNRISEGNVYEKLNFILKREYNQDYSYVLEGSYNKRYNKQGQKKTKEERLINKTEAELRKDQGYYRIWDCGKKLWVFSLQN